MRRKLWITLAGLVTALGILVLAWPVWTPWLLGPVLHRYGVETGGIKRDGYGRFELTNVRYAADSFRFEADRLKASVSLRSLLSGSEGEPARPSVEIDGWRVRIEPAEKPSDKEGSLAEVLEQARAGVPMAQRWLPRFIAQHGEVRFGEETVEIPRIEWRAGRLSAEVFSPKLDRALQMRAAVRAAWPWELKMSIPSEQVEATVEITQTEEERPHAKGSFNWPDTAVDFTATFDRIGWMPKQASLKADQFRVPQPWLDVPGYKEIKGSLSARWEESKLAAELSAFAEPVESEADPLKPAFDLALSATGDLKTLRVQRVDVSSAWFRVGLDDEARMDWKTKALADRAALRVSVDLDEQRRWPVRGELAARLVLEPGEGPVPRATLEVSGRDLEGGGIAATNLAVRANLVWPKLRLETAALEFEDLTARVSGEANLPEQQLISATATVQGRLGTNFLGFSADEIDLETQVNGPFKEPRFTARLRGKGVDLPQIRPLAVEVSAKGAGLELAEFTADVTSRESRLSVAGAGNFTDGRLAASLRRLELNSALAGSLALDEPVEGFAAPSQSAASNAPPAGWEISVKPFTLRGTNAALRFESRLAWPNRGQVRAAATNLSTMLLSDFLETNVREVFVRGLQLDASWTNGPVTFNLSADAEMGADRGPKVGAEIRAQGDASGLAIGRLVIVEETKPLVTGHGALPITIDPTVPKGWAMLTNRNFAFEAESRPPVLFWNQLGGVTNVTISEPRVRLTASGTLTAPVASVEVRIPRIEGSVGGLTNGPLTLENIDLQAEARPDRIRLVELSLRALGQPVEATGELPMEVNLSRSWSEWMKWEKATGKVIIDEAAIAAFAKVLPAVLTSEGAIDSQVELRPGLMLDGHLKVENASTRPIARLGPIQNVQATLLFEGKEVRIEEVSGLLGGEPLRLSGTVDLARRNEKSGMPLTHLQMRGTRLPLARQPDLIVRSDLDLLVTNTPTEVMLVSGTVTLRDSYFLSDVRSLVPGRRAQPSQRPPYFSVETFPLSEWRLNLNVQGERFLTVRSPLFRGEISAALKIEGTLANPLVLGDLTIQSGLIQFPFANLRVTQGIVSLISDRPHEPELFITAASRVFGYDVTMEVTGSAQDAVVEFSSVPSLSSEQIVLMLTTGKMPGQGLTTSGQARAGRQLALFFGKSLFSRFGGGGSERLVIRSGENISEEGSQTYSVEYKLTEDISLVGEYDRFNDFNMGVKWKFYSK